MRDIRFILYEQLGIERLCKFDKFKDFSRETFDMVLEEAGQAGLGSDRSAKFRCRQRGVRVREGKGESPGTDSMKPSRSTAKGGWMAASVDAEAGGQGLPDSVALATAEMFVGRLLLVDHLPRPHPRLRQSDPTASATPEQKELYLEKMYSGQWTGTMCLTEPQAGSAVGDVKTAAKKQGDHYLIQGTKIFITAGDHDLAENIIHAVLARTENAPAGTKGLSLFVVPKIRVNAGRFPGRAQRRELRRDRAQDGPQGIRHGHAEFRRRREMPRAIFSGRKARASSSCSR